MVGVYLAGRWLRHGKSQATYSVAVKVRESGIEERL